MPNSENICGDDSNIEIVNIHGQRIQAGGTGKSNFIILLFRLGIPEIKIVEVSTEGPQTCRNRQADVSYQSFAASEYSRENMQNYLDRILSEEIAPF